MRKSTRGHGNATCHSAIVRNSYRRTTWTGTSEVVTVKSPPVDLSTLALMENAKDAKSGHERIFSEATYGESIKLSVSLRKFKSMQ